MKLYQHISIKESVQENNFFVCVCKLYRFNQTKLSCKSIMICIDTSLFYFLTKEKHKKQRSLRYTGYVYLAMKMYTLVVIFYVSCSSDTIQLFLYICSYFCVFVKSKFLCFQLKKKNKLRPTETSHLLGEMTASFHSFRLSLSTIIDSFSPFSTSSSSLHWWKPVSLFLSLYLHPLCD